MGPIESSDSDANLVVLHAPNHRRGLGPMETSNLVQITLFCTHKTTGVVWDPERLVILVIMSLL